MAKYVLSWTNKDTTEEGQHRLLDVYSKWSPAPNTTIHQFVNRCDGRGGFSIVEGDDPGQILHDTALFSPWLDFEVFPVLDIIDAVAIESEAMATRDSIS